MNTMSIHRVFFCSLFGLVVLSACSRNLTYMPGIDIPIEKMNQQIKIYAPPEANTFEQGKAIGFVLINETQTKIYLDESSDIKLYYRKSEDWLPLENDLHYPDRRQYVSPGDISREGLFLFAIPKIIEDTPVTVRVIVIGHQEDSVQGTGGGLAAFVDFELSPIIELIP